MSALPSSAAVLGAGALGSSLAPALQALAIDVTTWSRSQGSLPPRLRKCALVLLAVPDFAVASLSAQLAGSGLVGKGQLVVHLAGALPLQSLRAALDAGARTGSLHPLRAFARGTPTSFAGAHAGIAGSDARALATLRQLASALGMTPLEVSDDARALYHAAAVLAAGSQVALFAAAERAFATATGADDAEARAALLPLALGALQKLQQLSPAQALTGPVARGDAATLAAHRRALHLREPRLLPLYDLLSTLSLSLARDAGRLTPAALDAVARAIRAAPAPASGSSTPRPRRPGPATRAASSPPPARGGRPPAPPPRGRGTRRRS